MSIFLYVVRHGEAEPVLLSDKERALTEHGRWEAKRTSIWLGTQLPKFDMVFCSPYVRAQQTKSVIVDHIAFDEEQELAELVPSGDPYTVVGEILASIKTNVSSNQHILCVSHMPLVSYLIGELTGYTPIMATAGVAKIKIDLDNWKGLLETLIAPDQMM